MDKSKKPHMFSIIRHIRIVQIVLWFLIVNVCCFKQSSGSLMKELQAIMPQLDDMKRKRNERKSQFAEVLKQINSITMELAGSMEENIGLMVIDESYLSMKRLDDLRNQLLLLQKEKVFFLLISAVLNSNIQVSSCWNCICIIMFGCSLLLLTVDSDFFFLKNLIWHVG